MMTKPRATEEHTQNGIIVWRWAYTPLRRVRIVTAAPGVKVRLEMTAHYGAFFRRANQARD